MLRSLQLLEQATIRYAQEAGSLAKTHSAHITLRLVSTLQYRYN